MYSDMSMRTMACSSSNRNSASARASSVLPTPVGPRNRKEPIGRLGSWRPARERRTRVRRRRSTASSWPMTRSRRRSSMWISFSTSPSSSLDTGIPVQLGHDLGDVLVVDLLLEEACVADCDLAQLRLELLDRLLEAAGSRRSAARRARLQLAARARRARRRGAACSSSLLGLADRVDHVLLVLPVRLHRARLLAQVGQLALDRLAALALDASSFSFFSAWRSISSCVMRRSTSSISMRHRVDLDAQPRGGLVDQVDGLVRQEAVGDVAVARAAAAATIAASWMRTPWCDLVALLEPAQDGDRVLDARLVRR